MKGIPFFDGIRWTKERERERNWEKLRSITVGWCDKHHPSGHITVYKISDLFEDTNCFLERKKEKQKTNFFQPKMATA